MFLHGKCPHWAKNILEDFSQKIPVSKDSVRGKYVSFVKKGIIYGEF